MGGNIIGVLENNTNDGTSYYAIPKNPNNAMNFDLESLMETSIQEEQSDNKKKYIIGGIGLLGASVIVFFVGAWQGWWAKGLFGDRDSSIKPNDNSGDEDDD
jgi:hypothetical protein